MTATTKLEAVNVMLSTIGESPVNSLTSGLVEAEVAAVILDSTSKAVQAEGWNFNRELKLPFSPDPTGFVNLPNNVLRADATLTQQSRDLVQRGSKMYDKERHTYVIAETVDLDVVLYLPFEDLPEVARRYINIKAARVFQDRIVGSDTLHGFTQRDEQMAYYELKEFEGESEDYNIFDNASVTRVITRNIRGVI